MSQRAIGQKRIQGMTRKFILRKIKGHWMISTGKYVQKQQGEKGSILHRRRFFKSCYNVAQDHITYQQNECFLNGLADFIQRASSYILVGESLLTSNIDLLEKIGSYM